MVPGVQEEGKEARGSVQPCVLGCTKKATCFHTTNKPVTFATLPGLVSERHPASRWSGLERNLGHRESKSKELLLVQEGGLSPSHQVLVLRPSPLHSVPCHETAAF